MNGEEKKMREIIAVKPPGVPMTQAIQPAIATKASLQLAAPSTLTWEAPEFEFFHKTTRWYIFSATVALACIALAVWQRSFSFIILTVVGYITVVGWSQKPPRRIQYQLAGEGIYVNERLYSYNSFAWFSIMDDGSLQELILAPKSKASSRLRIIFASPVGPEAARTHLRRILQENKDFEEQFFDLLAKRIGF